MHTDLSNRILPESSTILVIDDEEKNRLAISAVLRHAPEPYTVLTAPNGLVGCKIAEAQKPHLIIMDWIMPEMSGLEALVYLKEQEATRDIPVVMLTGLGSSKHVEYALNAGAADYLRIPVDKIELLARVRAAIALAKSYRQIKEQTERLEAQNHELIALNQEKNQFLGIAAHDLKNPLNNITDLARIIETELFSMPQEEVQEFARLIRQSANKMFELVRNLLDVNAIEQGGIKPRFVSFDMREVVRRVAESYMQRSSVKNIALIVDLPDLPTWAFADEQLTEQIVENLISNAVKYSPIGRNVFVRVRHSSSVNGHSSLAIGHSSEENSLHPPNQLTNVPMTNDQLTNDQSTPDFVRVEVQDEGPGISADDQKKLFGKFARLSAQPTGGEHSTGLGLSIVKLLAEVMKGRVWCESTLGEGATFLLQLPMSRS